MATANSQSNKQAAKAQAAKPVETTVLAVERALQLIERLADAAEGLSLADIARDLIVNKAIALRLLETLEQTKTIEPVPPSRLVPGMPRDIETIALKCLQKDPAKRYGTARELAEDLQRFLDGRPISARPVGRAERLVRWCRRYPLAAGLCVALALSVAAGFLAVYSQMRRAGREAAAAIAAIGARSCRGVRAACCAGPGPR